jgi:hypothetical protein
VKQARGGRCWKIVAAEKRHNCVLARSFEGRELRVGNRRKAVFKRRLER